MSSAAKYYDHHDILAGETAIPCTLMTQVNACGRALDQSSEHSNLKKGHGLDLPLWLATDVAARNMVTVRWECEGSCRHRSLFWVVSMLHAGSICSVLLGFGGQ